MNKLNYLQIKDMLLASEEGEKLEVRCDGIILKQLQEEFPKLTWSQITIGHFILTVPPKKTISAKSDIEQAINEYPGGMFKVDHPTQYVRVVVSQYNIKHSTQFKVRFNDGCTYIYREGSENDFIRQSDYDAKKKQFIAELEAMRPLVRPDEFFEYVRKDYDNGIPSVTASDLEPSIDDWDFPKRGIVYVCDDCGEIVPKEDGEVEVCSSCMALREANEPPTKIVGSALPMEQQFEDDEIEDDIAPIQAKECEVCGEEFPTDDPFERKCDVCRM